MKYQSNMKGVLDKLKGKIKSIETKSTVLLITIATSLQASNGERIHEKGKAVDGSKIGSYSKKEIYVNPENSPKIITPKGKNGKSSFKNGNKKKTAYFSSGYKGFRSAIGRDTSTVNLALSGKLSKEFGIAVNGQGVDVGFTTEYASTLAEGHEDKYNKKIWGVSKRDRVEIKNITENYINKKLRGGKAA